MRKAIVSVGSGPQRDLLRLTSRTFRPYAERHGYDLHLFANAPQDVRPPSWSRIELFRRLHSRYDLLVWLDADLVIVDGRRDIATELPADRMLGLVQHETDEGTMPNAGVMLLRCGDETLGFLDDVWAQEDLVDHKWWENAAICRLLGYDLDPVALRSPTRLLTDLTTFIDPRWNSIPDARARRPFIRHFPGYATGTRLALMRASLVEAAARRAIRLG